MLELSGYAFSALRRGEFTLYRGSGDGFDPILLVEPAGEYPAREFLRQLEHEHGLRAELNAEWAVRPIALSRHNGRLALVLEDPGGEPLDQLLGPPMDMTRFLRIAIPLAAAIGQVLWTDLTPPEWRDRHLRATAELKRTGTVQPYEREYFRKDGRRMPALIGSAALGAKGDQGVAFVLDLTEQKRAEAEARESERRFREVQMELAHANRVTTMGQLTASIAHEVSQPLAAVIISAQTALRWMGRDPPDLPEAAQALDSIVRNGMRASNVIDRMRALFKKASPSKASLNINEVLGEVIALTRGEAVKNGVAVHMQPANGLPAVRGDRVQLQQVVLNLIMNAIEAMIGLDEERREVRISTEMDASGCVLVTIRDLGPGLDPNHMARLFEAFYTTKPNGMGMGLAICRSIIDAHGGRLWARPGEPRGAVFQFTLPADREGSTPAGHAGEMPAA